MKTPTLLTIDRVPVADIDARSRLRPVSPAAVDSLVQSITETGVMKDAIHVRKKKSGQLVLIAGAHRLAAAQVLGWTDIEAKVWTDVTDDWSLLMEVDDNIAGAELNPLDTAVFLATRKDIYERLHPQSKVQHGAALAARRWNAADTMSVASFARTTAEKFGMSERHVRRMVEAGSKILPDQAALLRSAPRQVALADLMAIAKIVTHGERVSVINALVSGSARNAAQARAAFAGPKTTDDTPERDAAFAALVKAWTRAPMAVRRRFATEFGAQVAEAADGDSDA
jgi:ParB family transcriptional regulator, chromosome partitioning protein